MLDERKILNIRVHISLRPDEQDILKYSLIQYLLFKKYFKTLCFSEYMKDDVIIQLTFR
jgi:hypothetical protein